MLRALVTHDDIRAWSPMVGYSGCDARVFWERRRKKDNTPAASSEKGGKVKRRS